jgi:cell fate regulator YaaT (PSP1 superfamily)
MIAQGVSIVGIKVRDRGMIKKVGTYGVVLEDGDRVILEVEQEMTYGVVYGMTHGTPFVPPMRAMKTILRKANAEDLETIARHNARAAEGMAFWRELIDLYRIPMKPVEVVCAFDHPKMIFMYTAEERVDFRSLVKDIVRRFRARAEMRQIGARDEAKLLGGVGLCGLVLCCASFLTDFHPVTMKMVRAQGLPLDDNKLLGLCGRLKCCLAYEYEEGERFIPSQNNLPLIQVTPLSSVPKA